MVLFATLVCFSGFMSAYVTDSSSAETTGTDYEKYYYNTLNDYQKQIYDGIDSTSIENPQFKINVPDTVGKSVSEVTKQITNDISTVMTLYKDENLYKYWVASAFYLSYTSDGDKIVSSEFKVTLETDMMEYGSTNAEVENSVVRIKDVINGFSDGIEKTSTFTKVQSIHSIVMGLLEYDDTMPDTIVPRNIATAFLGGSFENPALVVCEGYAKAFKAICDVYGVPCIIVTGMAGNTDALVGHMWNEVMMDDGKWYLVDCTWDDQSANMYSDFMLVGSETQATHFDNKPVKDSHRIDAMYPTKITLSESAFGRPAYEIRLKTDSTDCALLYYNHGDSIKVPYVPVKAATTTETYTFSGWDCGGTTAVTLPDVESDATYVAVFSTTQTKYHIIFKNPDGTVLSEDSYAYGETVTVPKAEKKADKYARYTFLYWSIDGKTKVDVTPAYADTTYIAVYEESVFHYTVTFKDYDDSIISTKTDYVYGETIIEPSDPYREKTETQVFKFRGWNDSPSGDGYWFVEDDTVEKDVTYYAIYFADDRYYTVILNGVGGTLIAEQSYRYNELFVPPTTLVYVQWKTAPPTYITADGTYQASVCSVISDLTVVTSSESNTITVPEDVISSMRYYSGGTFLLSGLSITFDSDATNGLTADQTLKVYNKSTSSLSDSARSKLGDAEVYEISFGTNDSAFSAGTATITIPVTLSRGQSGSDVKVFYVDGDDVSEVPCTFEDGKVSFETNHFSVYAVQLPNSSSNLLGLLQDNVVLIGILVIAIIGMLLTYRLSKA